MVHKEKYKRITWIDLENPTEKELSKVAKEHKIHKLVKDELSRPSDRPKVDRYKDHLYLILHFPIYRHDHGEAEAYEIDFVIGKNFIITTRYTPVPAIDRFMQKFASDTEFKKEAGVKHAGFVFYYLLRSIYQSLEGHLEDLEYELGYIEEQIFQGEQRTMVEYLGIVNHNILDFRRALKTHSTVLASLEEVGTDQFGKAFSYYLRALTGEHTKLWNAIDDNYTLLRDLRETNDSILNTKTNETMKTLTIMAFITFPLTLLAGLFGMNTQYMPLIGQPNDFWLILGIMVGGVLLMLAWFKYKRWL